MHDWQYMLRLFMQRDRSYYYYLSCARYTTLRGDVAVFITARCDWCSYPKADTVLEDQLLLMELCWAYCCFQVRENAMRWCSSWSVGRRDVVVVSVECCPTTLVVAVIMWLCSSRRSGNWLVSHFRRICKCTDDKLQLQQIRYQRLLNSSWQRKQWCCCRYRLCHVSQPR